jgi:hypothetical protein
MVRGAGVHEAEPLDPAEEHNERLQTFYLPAGAAEKKCHEKFGQV